MIEPVEICFIICVIPKGFLKSILRMYFFGAYCNFQGMTSGACYENLKVCYDLWAHTIKLFGPYYDFFLVYHDFWEVYYDV